MTQQELLDHLEIELRGVLADVRLKLAGMPPEALLQRPTPESWNALECVAHLNRYAEDYMPPLNRAIHRAKARRWAPAAAVRYTARGRRLLRRADGNKTYKSPKRYNFLNQPLGAEILKSFIINCEQLLRVLQEARKIDVNRATVRKANAWFGRYTVGNLLEFLVQHSRRHVAQAVLSAA
jgi:hypothetical protein